MSKSLSLQSWPQVPSIAHFCSLFREAFKLLEFDIQDLEESLLLYGSDEDYDQLVLQLIVKLLQGCLPIYKNRINRENYNTYLRQFFISKQEDAEEEKLEYRFKNPFEDNNKEYSELDLREKVLVLHQLCELRLEAPDISEKVKQLDGASLRVDPLGEDSEGTTYWYFYGTRLYKENYSIKEKKKSKKHKKLKKKKRKKSRESIESVESLQSSDEDPSPGSWSVACVTEEDWDHLVLKYKQSDRREDRKLFRLLKDCFLPEIREMFVEKRKEDKRKMKQQLSRRSSNRVEVLKQQQEEKDRQLALKLAQQNKKSGRELRGRKRGRKRKHEESEDKEDEPRNGEKGSSEEFNIEDDDSSDNQGDREERAKQREMMKEMRARREAEKMVETKFREEVLQQRAKVKEVETGGKKRGRKSKKELLEKAKLANLSEKTAPTPRPQKTRSSSSSSSSSREQSPELSEADSDDVYKPPKDYKSSSRTIFSNALIRAGTKSTKDSSLEKEKQKSIKEILTDKPVVRKTPGLLLQSAGKGLLNKAKDSPEEAPASMGSSPRRGSGISFGLWGGQLPVEQSIISSSFVSSYDDKPGSVLGEDKKVESAKKVFSNWGGDFFKKNLDFRANTNRILEKLTKSASDVNGDPAENTAS